MSCPYRKEHENDGEGVCRHCYAKMPKLEPMPTPAPLCMPPWGAIWGASLICGIAGCTEPSAGFIQHGDTYVSRCHVHRESR